MAFVLVFGTLSHSASAAALQVSPVTIELPATAATTQLTLHNLGDTPVNAQIRVYQWTQQAGADQLTPSTDVVASPPAATLDPHQDYTVRLVRVSKQPVMAEETYRLLVDELPSAPTADNTASNIRFVVRYSVPVFFIPANTAAKLTWTAAVSNGHLSVSLQNDGTQHVRVSRLNVEGPSGMNVSFGEGLVGYVLPHSIMRWISQSATKGLAAGAPLNITAEGNNGPIGAKAVLQTGNN
ncbi:MAG TPA: molecular chaperone [Rhizomicrobium sp.]|nr:molecular chaperone [Rhizomicrobium sp.]